MRRSHCQTLARPLTHFIPGQISDSRPLNVFMLADDERCHITINPLTRNWSAPLLNSNYMAKLQARGVWTHFVAWLKTIHHGLPLQPASDLRSNFFLFHKRICAYIYFSKHRATGQKLEGIKLQKYGWKSSPLIWSHKHQYSSMKSDRRAVWHKQRIVKKHTTCIRL